MDRRTLMKRAGTVGAAAVGGSGLASAKSSEPTHVAWTFEDGREEVIPKSEFERRSDTPSLSELDTTDDPGDQCCCCVNGLPCTPCYVCVCY